MKHLFYIHTVMMTTTQLYGLDKLTRLMIKLRQIMTKLKINYGQPTLADLFWASNYKQLQAHRCDFS